jgi:hypothetical protein
MKFVLTNKQFNQGHQHTILFNKLVINKLNNKSPKLL